MTFRKSSLLILLATTQPDVAFSFSPPNNHPSTAQLLHTMTTTRTKLNAMERLHRDPSTLNTYGLIEHVYSLQDIDTITQHITDDEWTALGSVIAETMLEMILDVGEDGLMERGWVERTVLANRIAEDVSSVVEKELHKLRSQSSNAFEHYGHEVLPQELLTSLQTLLRHELDAIINLATDRKKQSSSATAFDYDKRDLSPLVLSAISDAIESYCNVSNMQAPFFNLNREMEHRIAKRRRELLLRHSKGYETVRDVEDDIRGSRKEWVRNALGNRAASHYEFGEVITNAGNGRSMEKEKRVREEWREGILNALFLDGGGLMP
mmetsp:Transcript_30099/g.55302  ORF Transcript_30099/g.55302 Transcript_30099/m.55302 type:complete len:322 (+) Transcript_30099:145-1110(+)